MTQETIAEKLARDAVDGVMKRAKLTAGTTEGSENASIDPETQRSWSRERSGWLPILTSS